MSSILKALEKVETNLADQKRRRQAAGSGRRRRAVIHRFDLPQRRSRVIAWVACIVLVGFSGWWLAFKWPTRPADPAHQETVPTVQAPTADPPRTDPGPTPADPPTTPGRTVSGAAALIQPQTPPRPDARPQASTETLAGRVAGTENEEPSLPLALEPADDTADLQEDPAALEPPSDALSPAMDIPDLEAAAAPESSGPPQPGDLPEDLSEEIPILTESDLELHAIAWASDPGRRIAVINNSIVREGEIVEGFDIIRIAPDAIVVEKDSEQWRLMLR